MYLPSLKPVFLHLKMDGWNLSFLLGWPIFNGYDGYVSFRDGPVSDPDMVPWYLGTLTRNLNPWDTWRFNDHHVEAF